MAPAAPNARLRYRDTHRHGAGAHLRQLPLLRATASAWKKGCSTATICRAPIARRSKPTLQRMRPRPIGDAACRSCGCFRAESFSKSFTMLVSMARGLIVGFNLPFDLSRLAVDFGNARDKRFAGGFSLALWDYDDEDGKRQINKYRPRIAIKHIDSKRALKGFTGTLDADPVDLIPEGSETGEPEDEYKFRGHFLDLRTLAFVLTDRGHSLDIGMQSLRRRTREAAPSNATASSRRNISTTTGATWQRPRSWHSSCSKSTTASTWSCKRRRPTLPASLGKGAPAQDGDRADPGAADDSRSGTSATRSRRSSVAEPAPTSAKSPFRSSTPTFSPCIRRSTR